MVALKHLRSKCYVASVRLTGFSLTVGGFAFGAEATTESLEFSALALGSDLLAGHFTSEDTHLSPHSFSRGTSNIVASGAEDDSTVCTPDRNLVQRSKRGSSHNTASSIFIGYPSSYLAGLSRS